MSTTTFELGSAQLTVDTQALLRAWLEKTLGPTGTSNTPTIPPAAPAANEGERYVGTIIRADGSGHHLFRLPLERGKKMKWSKALEYATAQGAELPDRVESALLFATREEAEFEPEWYWTREQHAGNDDYAWCQDFGDGYQCSSPKGYGYRVVLVRRVAIQSSSH